MAATLWVNCMSRHKNFFTEALKATSRLLSVETRIERGGAQASVIFKSGLPFDIMHEYDDAMKPNLLGLQRIFHSLRMHLSVKDGRLAELKRLRDEEKTLRFLIGVNNHMNEKLYDVVKCKSQEPVVMTICLNGVGKTSVGFHHSLCTLDNKDVLCSLDMKVVFVDKVARRPTPLPKWYREKYSPLAQGPGTVIMKELRNQGSCFTYKLKVLPSDIDIQNHVSYLHYVRYCSDCAAIAFQQRALKNFTGEFVRHRVKRMSTLYLKEANLHDELDVDVWEDEKKSDTLNFVISKDGVDVFHSLVQFYRETKFMEPSEGIPECPLPLMAH
ncbi:uncharacterized protein [Ptychodera flava]|uniref:uncharacterized protein isoform X1 n=1 Tax=Ptychodera flava TaxID=63121 RepID=UPI00396A3323